ncbi:MAG: M48 family metalloprotease [Methanobacteriaceae archaeon]|nr:M48 family metalloprotease [Methanobacteriaceae archaeon]
MSKNDRSAINPFTGKKHFDIVDDDKFLNQSYNEYYNVINQAQLLDNTVAGQNVFNVAKNLITAVEDYLSQIGRSDYTENYYDWEFHLISSDTVNAFCMPGGKIVMYSGILSIADTEEKVAFILGHEMAHALLDHSRTQASRQTAETTITTAARVGGIALGLMGLGELGNLAYAAANVADIGSAYFLMMPFGRTQELEADKLGMMIIYLAGYNIRNIPAFWQSMSENNSNTHDFFSTHPSDDKRINAMKQIITEIDNQKDIYSMPLLADSPDKTEPVNQADFSTDKNLISNSNDKMKFCPYCGTPADLDAVFCSNCGREFDVLKCPNCGVEIKDGDLFCYNCGNKLC